MEFFIGNPFTTAVGQLVEQATNSSLQSEDWGLNMEICDMVNETDDGAKDAVRAIKKRILGNRDFNEVMLTLSVLEACVKNCGHRFHSYVTTRDFVENVLVQTILPKNNPSVILQDRVLRMIQAWSDAFRSSPDLTGVVTVYEELRRKGIQFPKTQLNGFSPIHTPDRAAQYVSPVTVPLERLRQENSVRASQPQNTDTPLVMSPPQMEKLKGDLEMVGNNLSVMSQMMSQMEAGSVQQSDTQLLQKLYVVCKEMQSRMLTLIPRLTDEKLTEKLLLTNDDINTTFTRYHRCERNLKQQSNAQSGNLIEFGDTLETPDQPKTGNAAHSAASQSAVSTLSNQMAALSTKGHAFTQNNSSLENTVAVDGLAAPPRPQQHMSAAIPVDQSNMMDDIERWLEVEDDDEDTEGVTSEEFDKFLAERAKAADRLPSVTASLHAPQRSQP